MKKLLLFLFLFSATAAMAQQQWIRDVIKKMPIQSLPSSSSKTTPGTPGSRYDFPKECRQRFPECNIYKDFQRTQRAEMQGEEDGNIFIRHQKPNNNKFTILGISIGDFEDGAAFLATYDMNGNLIDLMEVAVDFGSLALKQYRLTADFYLNISELKPTSTTPILRGSDIASLDAQHIETVYQIDDNGKFIKKMVAKYSPMKYPMKELAGKMNIWERNEGMVSLDRY